MPDEPRKRRLLVIDDDEMLLQLMTRLAHDAGYEVMLAADGAPGLALARAERFDLVLLDINMPLMDGRDVLMQLRKDPRTAALPVLIYSSRGSQSDRLTALELGADDYMEKPFAQPELMRKIARLIEKAEHPDEEG